MSHRNGPILILFLALAGYVGTLSAQTQTFDLHIVEVQIYDYADLKPVALHELAGLTQSILSGTGLSVQVKICRGSLAVACETETGGIRRLAVRLVAGEARKMNNMRRPPLGQSFVGPEGGVYASVFLERVQDAATDADVPWTTVLAYAAAHEVGHLLLGNEAHAPRGLMKATWDRKDFQAMNQNGFHFSEEQERKLAERYGASGVAGVGSGVIPRNPF